MYVGSTDTRIPQQLKAFSAQIGFGVVRGGPEVRFHEGSTRVSPGFNHGSTRVPRGSDPRPDAWRHALPFSTGLLLRLGLRGRGVG